MDFAALIFLSVAVLFGVVLLVYVLKGKNAPKGFAVTHGLCAAMGIILLLFYALFTKQHHKHWDNLGIFVAVALVGIYLFTRDIRRKELPKWLAALHGAFGLFGLIYFVAHLIH